MGQDSSQVKGTPHNADGVIIKRDPEEKENENIHDVSNWEGSAAEEGSLRNGVVKVPDGRKKKRKKRGSSSSLKATFETAEDGMEAQPIVEDRDTPSLSRRTLETAQANRSLGTPSSVSRNPKMTEVEAKKRRLLAVASAAAGDVNGPYSEAEPNRRATGEDNDVDQDRRVDTDQDSQRDDFVKPAKKSSRSKPIAKRPVAGKASNRWTAEPTQGTKKSSTSKKVKNRKSIQNLASISIATDEEYERATQLQLPTPQASSQVRDQQSLEDPFTVRDIWESQIPKRKRNSNFVDENSPAGHKQRKDNLDKPYADEAISDEDLAGEKSTFGEPHSARKTYDSHHNISLPSPQTKKASIDRQFLNQAMEFIDPALRGIGMDHNQQPQEIGIYRDIATPQTARKRKRRLPIDEDTYVETPDSKAKTKKPPKQSFKPKTPNTNGRKSIVREFREESPDLDAPSTKVKRRKHTPKKANAPEPTAKGKFSTEELDLIQSEIVKHREMFDITVFDLNQIIQDTPGKLAPLWDEICAVLPDRPRAAIVKVCRRKFHNFGVRGKWTIEEDLELKEAYERFPKRWKQISQVLNRHHEDVRDRWRNYIVCGDSMKREQWTEEEEDNLRAVVGECILAVKELKAAEIARNPGMSHDHRPDIELIDWQIVSEKFGRTRSRLQCLDKWHRMTRLEDSEGASKELELGPNSWRVKTAYKDVKHMRREDYLELLIALRGSHAGREGKVNWAKLGDLDLRIKWTCMARKVAWKKLRASVPGNKEMKFQDIVTLLLNNLPENDAELEGADDKASAAPMIPFQGDMASPQRRSFSEAISSVDGDENENIDPHLNELDEGYFDPDDIQERHKSHSLSHQDSNFNRDTLREAIGEAYFDNANPDGEYEDDDMVPADHGSVDLDWPNQHRGAGSTGSRLRSPISFNVTPNREQSEQSNNSTHTGDEDIDMDIPARRPMEGFRRESVDLDMD